jgi:hypothetical protein
LNEGFIPPDATSGISYGFHISIVSILSPEPVKPLLSGVP